MTPRLKFAVGDRVRVRHDPRVYEIAQIDATGIFLWVQLKYVAKGLGYAPEELEAAVVWHRKPDGTVWLDPDYTVFPEPTG